MHTFRNVSVPETSFRLSDWACYSLMFHYYSQLGYYTQKVQAWQLIAWPNDGFSWIESNYVFKMLWKYVWVIWHLTHYNNSIEIAWHRDTIQKRPKLMQLGLKYGNYGSVYPTGPYVYIYTYIYIYISIFIKWQLHLLKPRSKCKNPKLKTSQDRSSRPFKRDVFTFLKGSTTKAPPDWSLISPQDRASWLTAIRKNRS